MRLALFSSFALGILISNVFGQADISAKKAIKLMGCSFEIAATADTEAHAWQAINLGIAEIERIERLISSWDARSQTSEINRMAGQTFVKVDKELYDLIFRAKKVSRLTSGAFDISFASMDPIWKFDKTEQKLPDSSLVLNSKSKIGYAQIMLNPEDTSVYLSEGMRIGFGAIGKGYAANRAKNIMRNSSGVTGGVVNASGDLLCWGNGTNADGYKINIANPKLKDQPFGWLKVKDIAIVTSGDYEKYFTSEGKRYAHIIDPRSGYPTTGLTSVTIICPDAELADALATSVFVLGKDDGLSLINKLNNVACVVVTNDGKLYQSNELKLNYY